MASSLLIQSQTAGVSIVTQLLQSELLSTAFLLLWMFAGKRLRRVPETMWLWAGTLLGSLCFLSILITQTPAPRSVLCLARRRRWWAGCWG
jgi:hypothetical protein